MKLTIGKKILLGYVPLVVLIAGIIVFVLLRLNHINRLSADIVKVDLVIKKAADDLVDILLAQESYVQRYAILKSQDMLSLFWKRDQEFAAVLQEVAELPASNRPARLIELQQNHREYTTYFESGTQTAGSTSPKARFTADSLRTRAFDKQVEILKETSSEAGRRQAEKTLLGAAIGRRTFRSLTVAAILGSALALCIALLTARGIVGSIGKLKSATARISEGKFEQLPSVTVGDELGDLSRAFNEMATRLVRLEEIYMDSSPLTRLPGGVAIESCVKSRIEGGEHFAFCMMDLDNFKPFNDRYGYARGNDVIKHTAKLIQNASRDLGSPSDFVGHIGGDDFALITGSDNYSDVCNAVIHTFDATISDFYDPEDREGKCIVSKSRRGETLSFPFMTISIAALDTRKSVVHNHIEVGEIAAELKKYAKTFTESKLVVDRRGGRQEKPA